MLVKEIKKIAESRGVEAGKLKKLDLIRKIQSAEGNNACYKTDISPTCEESECLWFGDCVPKKKIKKK